MLHLTDNSKVKFYSEHCNTVGFNPGLPQHGGTCPGATSEKGGCLALKKVGGKQLTCYMDTVIKIYKDVGKWLAFNTSMLAGKSFDELFAVFDSTIAEFVKKDKGRAPCFRLCYSGDIKTVDEAKAWAAVINKYADVKFWVYTRSFFAVPILAECKNLALYISADPVNYLEAQELSAKYAGYNNVGIAFMGNTPPVSKRWVPCPEITGKVKNKPKLGACAQCKLCLTYSDKIKLRNIQFRIH